MTEMITPALAEARAQWIAAGRPLPLEVSRAKYDLPFPRSWEVLYIDSVYNGNSGSSTPIAEFTEWSEAQEWALAEARKSTRRDDQRLFVGPKTHLQQVRADAWDAYEAGTGPHPFTLERSWWELR